MIAARTAGGHGGSLLAGCSIVNNLRTVEQGYERGTDREHRCSSTMLMHGAAIRPADGGVSGGAPRRGGGGARRHPRYILGSSTVSITWITPLLAMTSALATVALSIRTLPSLTCTASSCPCAVLADLTLTTSVDVTLPGTT